MGLLNSIVAGLWALPSRVPIYARRQVVPDDYEFGGSRIVYHGRTPAGVLVTHDEALRLSTVWACVTVISKSLASCEWTVLEEDSEGNRSRRRNTRLWWRLNKRPNSEMTAFSFREAALVQALLWGNFYAEIDRNYLGEPVNIWPINPDRCRFDRDRDGNLVLEVMNSGGRAILPYRDVFHLHGPSLTGIEGLNVIGYMARTLGHAAAAEIFGATFYGNGTQMGGILSTDGNLSEQQRGDLLKAIAERHGGPQNANRFLLLQGGLKFTQLSPTQEQSQFIETRKFMVEETARIFGVPPHKIGHLDRATNNNIEHQGLEFVRDALTPWAERLTQEADAKLLPFDNRALTTRLDLEWLAEGDSSARADADAKYVGAGILTRNEARRAHGWNAHPDGENLTAQRQYWSVGQIDEYAAAEIARTKREATPKSAPEQEPMDQPDA